MSYSHSFIVPGSPQALARPKLTKSKLYDSQKHFKLNYGLYLDDQFQGKRKFTGAVFLDVIFYMDILKASAQRRAKLLDRPHFAVPYLSSLIRYLEDSAENAIFDNDCLIWKISASKIWSSNPRTEFTISEIE